MLGANLHLLKQSDSAQLTVNNECSYNQQRMVINKNSRERAEDIKLRVSGSNYHMTGGSNRIHYETILKNSLGDCQL